MENPTYPRVVKPKSYKVLFYESPIKFVEGFGEIKFKKHTEIFGGFEGVYNFMGQNDSIKDFMPFYIVYLFQRDERRKKGLEAISYDFGDNFIKYIAEGYWPVLTRGRSFVLFNNKREKSGIDGRYNLLVVARFFNNIPDLVFDQIPA